MTDSTYTTLSLSWTKPKDIEGVEDEAKGYFVEIRPAENTEWDRCNSNVITMTTYTVKGMKSMAMYWVRVIATNDGGEGEPQELDNYILAMPPPGKEIHLKVACVKKFLYIPRKTNTEKKCLRRSHFKSCKYHVFNHFIDILNVYSKSINNYSTL